MGHEQYEDLIALDALDALDAAEKQRLEAHLGECDACRRAADESRETATLVGLSAAPVAPPDLVRARVMRAVRSPGAAPAERSSGRWWPLAASVLLGLALVTLWAYWRVQGDLAAKSARVAELTREKVAAQQKEIDLQRKIDVLTSARSFELAGQEAAPASSARVFIDEKERTALVFFQNLPASPSDKSYQLWIIRGDRPAPQSAGVFEVGPDGRATLGLRDLPVDTEIKAFALTLEPRGGGEAPTGAKYLVGGV